MPGLALFERLGKANCMLYIGLPKRASPGMRPPQANTSLAVWIQNQRIQVVEGSYPGPVEVTLGLGQEGLQVPTHFHGDAMWYPFVSLHFELWFMAFWTADNGGTALDLPLPLAFTLTHSHIPMYQTSNPNCVFGDRGIGASREWTVVVGDIGINNIFKRYAIGALHVLTWALAVASFSMSIIWAVTEHIDLQYDLLCFCGAFLFALPTMRGLLPAAPQAGLCYDLMNIHAQLWLISIGIIIQFGRVFFYHAFRKATAIASKCTCACATCDMTGDAGEMSHHRHRQCWRQGGCCWAAGWISAYGNSHTCIPCSWQVTQPTPDPRRHARGTSICCVCCACTDNSGDPACAH